MDAGYCCVSLYKQLKPFRPKKEQPHPTQYIKRCGAQLLANYGIGTRFGWADENENDDMAYPSGLWKNRLVSLEEDTIRRIVSGTSRLRIEWTMFGPVIGILSVRMTPAEFRVAADYWCGAMGLNLPAEYETLTEPSLIRMRAEKGLILLDKPYPLSGLAMGYSDQMHSSTVALMGIDKMGWFDAKAVNMENDDLNFMARRQDLMTWVGGLSGRHIQKTPDMWTDEDRNRFAMGNLSR